MVNPPFRNYRIPAFADVPRSEVFFADTYDTIGPLGAKAQGECAINPVAPAIANALADATGVRFAHLPLRAGPHLRPARRSHERRRQRRASGRRGRVTIVTQTRVRPESDRGLRPLAGRDQRGHRAFSRLHQADGDAAEPAGAGRLGDPATLRRRPDAATAWLTRRAVAAHRRRGADAGRPRRHPPRHRTAVQACCPRRSRR